MANNLRKKLKSQVAQTAGDFAAAIESCSVHGDGLAECECEALAYQYDYLLTTLRQTDEFPFDRDNQKKKGRRKKYRPIHAAPHFVKPELAEFADALYGKAISLKHEPEVIWDDSCCAAMYCSNCGKWSHAMYDYLDDTTGRESEGVLFEQECGT
jgi:hypothetical protein